MQSQQQQHIYQDARYNTIGTNGSRQIESTEVTTTIYHQPVLDGIYDTRYSSIPAPIDALDAQMRAATLNGNGYAEYTWEQMQQMQQMQQNQRGPQHDVEYIMASQHYNEGNYGSFAFGNGSVHLNPYQQRQLVSRSQVQHVPIAHRTRSPSNDSRHRGRLSSSCRCFAFSSPPLFLKLFNGVLFCFLSLLSIPALK